MEAILEIEKMILREFREKAEISNEDISFFDFAQVDLMDKELKIEFMKKDDQEVYVFWHSYHLNVGSIATKEESGKESKVLQSWGDWSEM